MSNTANENPDRYDIQAESTHILDGLHFAEEHPEMEVSTAAIVRRLRFLLVQVQGPAWMHCTIEQHAMPDGLMVFTASRNCKRCHAIHTLIALLKDDGSFDFAASMEEE